MIFVDASAFVAMLLREPGYERLFDRIEQGGVLFTSPMAVYEATLAVAKSVKGGVDEAARDLAEFMSRGDIQTVAIDAEHGHGALVAFERFGKGRHRAKLNMGDCFAYAVAKARSGAILFVGDDFSHTDLPDARASP